MNDTCGIIVSYDESDIIKDCKYLQKTDRKSIIGGSAYGYECIIKRETKNEPLPTLLLWTFVGTKQKLKLSIMARGICKVCGCTDNDPCFNPLHGNCWWVDDTHELCSHCADPEIANDPETRHCINTTDPYYQSVAEILVCKNCKHWKQINGIDLADEDKIYGICKLYNLWCWDSDEICADFEEKEDSK